MKRVLFICEGNVGRSQMAEAFYNHYTGQKLATSAGVDYVGPRYDFTPREDVMQVMKERGIDVGGHTIKQIIPEHLKDIDEIVVLCHLKHLPYFVREAGINIVNHEIKDLYDSSGQGLRNARDHIEEMVKEYIRAPAYK